jgi:hypothetical protein
MNHTGTHVPGSTGGPPLIDCTSCGGPGVVSKTESLEAKGTEEVEPPASQGSPAT